MSLTRVANLPLISLTLVLVVAAVVVDTGGKFATGVVDTSSKFAAGVLDTGCKFATCVIDTDGVP
jgi:hypothetical protein